MILLDTNILIYSKQASSAYHAGVTNKLLIFVATGKKLIVSPQILREFYVVATKPVNSNGLGMSENDAMTEVENIVSVYTFLNDKKDLFEHWKTIVKQYQVKGKNAHDANVFAFMKTYNIKEIFSINDKDFKRYQPDITIHTL